MNAKGIAVMLAPLAAVLGAIGYKRYEKKEESSGYSPAQVPQMEERGEVLVPFINRPEYEIPGGYSGGVPTGEPVGGGETINIPQPVKTISVNPKELVELNGTTADDYTDANTYEFDNAYARFDILTEGGDVLISLKRINDGWTTNIPIPEGFGSFDFQFRGIRLKSRVSGTNVKYYLTLYRW